MTRRSAAIALALLVAAAALIYGLGLDRTPPHLQRDEAVFALQSMSIAATGRDIDGRRLPLYFEMRLLRDHVWFQPLLVYWTALFLKLVPPSQAAFRIPSVAIGAIDVLLLYFVAARLFRGRPDPDLRARLQLPTETDSRFRAWGLAGAALLAATPAHMVHSRLAMDFIYPLPFVLGWMLCLQRYFDERRTPLLFAATSMLGIGFYSYIASVMMMPVYLLLTFGALLGAGVRSGRPYLVAVAGFAWPLAAMVAWMPAHLSIVGDTLGRYHIGGGSFTPGVVTDRVSVYWRFFDPAFLFLIGGYTRLTNSTRLVGVFLAPLLVLVPLGLADAWSRRRTPMTMLVALGFLLAPIAATIAVPEEPYASDRELAVLVFGVLLALFGLERLLASRARWARPAAIALVALVPLHFAVFLWDYFGDYHRRAAFWFDWNHLDALETVIAQNPRLDRPVYLSNADDRMMEAYWRLATAMHHAEPLLRKTTYFDARQLQADGMPPRALIVVNKNDTALLALAGSGALHTVAEIREPADPPFYYVLER